MPFGLDKKEEWNNPTFNSEEKKEIEKISDRILKITEPKLLFLIDYWSPEYKKKIKRACGIPSRDIHPELNYKNVMANFQAVSLKNLRRYFLDPLIQAKEA